MQQINEQLMRDVDQIQEENEKLEERCQINDNKIKMLQKKLKAANIDHTAEDKTTWNDQQIDTVDLLRQQLEDCQKELLTLKQRNKRDTQKYGCVDKRDIEQLRFISSSVDEMANRMNVYLTLHADEQTTSSGHKPFGESTKHELHLQNVNQALIKSLRSLEEESANNKRELDKTSDERDYYHAKCEELQNKEEHLEDEGHQLRYEIQTLETRLQKVLRLRNVAAGGGGAGKRNQQEETTHQARYEAIKSGLIKIQHNLREKGGLLALRRSRTISKQSAEILENLIQQIDDALDESN